MAVDLTVAFHVCLYTLFLESFLFFAVVMQTKNQEPGTNGGVARAFGMVFLCQALAALFLVLSEQLYDGYFSLYCSILSVGCIFLAVVFCIPAAAVIAFPDPMQQSMQALSFLAWVMIVLLCTFVFSANFKAGPDIPYITFFLRKELLGAITGALIVLAAASCLRMARPRLKGRNGAFILLAGLSLIVAFGALWMQLEPLCRQIGANEVWPESCPLPPAFDHNVLFTVLLMVANVLSAEGVLRLMAAGSGAEGYAEIITVH